MAEQDFVDDDILNPSHIPSKTLSSVPQMPDITVSLNGVLKLLKDLNPQRAAGPDQLKRIVLQRPRDVILPQSYKSFTRSHLILEECTMTGTLHTSALFSRREIPALPPIIC